MKLLKTIRLAAVAAGIAASLALVVPVAPTHAQSARPLPEPFIGGCGIHFNAPENAVDLICSQGWRGQVTGHGSPPEMQMVFAAMTNDWTGETQEREARWYNGSSLIQAIRLMNIGADTPICDDGRAVASQYC
jgi:hypothetical protein